MGDNLFNTGGSSTETETETAPGTENATVYVDGEPITIDDTTTAAELKEIAGAADEEILTFRDGDQPETINDDEYVLERATPSTKFEFQPVAGDDGGVFG